MEQVPEVGIRDKEFRSIRPTADRARFIGAIEKIDIAEFKYTIINGQRLWQIVLCAAIEVFIVLRSVQLHSLVMNIHYPDAAIHYICANSLAIHRLHEDDRFCCARRVRSDPLEEHKSCWDLFSPQCSSCRRLLLIPARPHGEESSGEYHPE
jgi:hypothetical protein